MRRHDCFSLVLVAILTAAAARYAICLAVIAGQQWGAANFVVGLWCVAMFALSLLAAVGTLMRSGWGGYLCLVVFGAWAVRLLITLLGVLSARPADFTFTEKAMAVLVSIALLIVNLFLLWLCSKRMKTPESGGC